jgi:hypothetical protein
MDTITYNDIQAPTVSSGYISSGIRISIGSTGYFNGIINIKADVSDNNILNTGSCEYTLDN